MKSRLETFFSMVPSPWCCAVNTKDEQTWWLQQAAEIPGDTG
jgi:hypothetical protein